MTFNHQPPSKRARMTAILIVFGAVVAAVATYYFRGFNELSFTELPEGAEAMVVDSYFGCGSLDQESYPIEDGVVTMEWSYAIKTSFIRYRIVGGGETLAEAEHEFCSCTRHELEL